MTPLSRLNKVKQSEYLSRLGWLTDWSIKGMIDHDCSIFIFSLGLTAAKLASELIPAQGSEENFVKESET